MITAIDFQDDNIVGFQMTGKITQDDIKPWAEKLDRKSDTLGKLRVYVEVEDMDAVTAKAALADLKFDVTHLGDFDKAAFVSDDTWTKISTFLADLVPSINAKQFSLDEKEEARQWIKADK